MMTSPFMKALDTNDGAFDIAEPLVVQGQPIHKTTTSTTAGTTGIPIVLGHPIIGGFVQWIAPKPPIFRDGMPVYEIVGTYAQIIQFPLRPGRAIMCFSGASTFLSFQSHTVD